MKKKSVTLFRYIGNIEGISYLLLIFIAMPLKYWADQPVYVTITGIAHGFLFTLFLIGLLAVWIINRWSFLKVLGAFIAAFIPFGTFYLDAKLRKQA